MHSNPPHFQEFVTRSTSECFPFAEKACCSKELQNAITLAEEKKPGACDVHTLVEFGGRVSGVYKVGKQFSLAVA